MGSDPRTHIRTNSKDNKRKATNIEDIDTGENEDLYDSPAQYAPPPDMKHILREYLTDKQKEFLLEMANELDQTVERELFSHTLAKVFIMITYFGTTEFIDVMYPS